MSENKNGNFGFVVILLIVVFVMFVMSVHNGVYDDYLGIDRTKQKWSVTGAVSERFDVVYVQKRGSEKIKIIRDKETGIAYLFAQDGDGAGMVPMNMKVELVNDVLKAITKGR